MLILRAAFAGGMTVASGIAPSNVRSVIGSAGVRAET